MTTEYIKSIDCDILNFLIIDNKKYKIVEINKKLKEDADIHIKLTCIDSNNKKCNFDYSGSTYIQIINPFII